MAIRDRSVVQREVDKARRKLDRLLLELKDAPTLPEEPPVGAVIKFTVQFDPGKAVYIYVAYRCTSYGSRWAMTGEHSRLFTWEELVAFMSRDHAVKCKHRPLEFQRSASWETHTAR